MKLLVVGIAFILVALLLAFAAARVLRLLFKQKFRKGSANDIEDKVKSEDVVDVLEDLAGASRIAAAISAAAALVAAPTGLMAIAVGSGLVNAPLITTMSPILGAVAVGSGAVFAAAKLYSKRKQKQASLLAGQSDA